MERQDYIVHMFDGAILEFDNVNYFFNDSHHVFLRGDIIVGVFVFPAVLGVINLSAVVNIPDDASSLTL